MTRPRCPKCQKYYVTQTVDQRRLPVRTAAAIKRSILREPAPTSPYRRYSCDICGHQWAMLVGGRETTTTTPALRQPRAMSVPYASLAAVHARSPHASLAEASASVPTYARAGRAGRSGTLMAAHPGASQRPRRAFSEDQVATLHRTPAQRPGSPARSVQDQSGTAAAAPLAAPPAATSTGPLELAPHVRWQERWLSFLPGHQTAAS